MEAVLRQRVALEDGEAALVLLAEYLGLEDDCEGDELCDHWACAQIGCLCDKRDRIRAILAEIAP